MMGKSLGLCQECESGNLLLNTFDETFQHNGKSVLVTGLEYGLCESCGADPVLVDQVKSNQMKITDAKRESLGLLSGDQIKAVRKFLKLTQQEAAEKLGGGANGFSKYERGETIQSVSMDNLLRLLAKVPQLLESLSYTPDQKSAPLAAATDLSSIAEEAEILAHLKIIATTIAKRRTESASVSVSEKGWRDDNELFVWKAA